MILRFFAMLQSASTTPKFGYVCMVHRGEISILGRCFIFCRYIFLRPLHFLITGLTLYLLPQGMGEETINGEVSEQ